MITTLTHIFKAVKRQIVDVFSASQQPAPMAISECKGSYPYGLPTSAKQLIYIGRIAYVVGYDPKAKIPSWVSYVLTPSNTLGSIKRSNAFAADYSLKPEDRAILEDYEHSDYDKGHNTPDDDNNWNVNVEKESFILTNMTPQNPNLNRGIWKQLETIIRSWAFNKQHPLCIYTGPIYSNTSFVIGKGNVTVPDSYYKIAIDTITNDSLGFIFKNAEHKTNDISLFQVTVSEIETATGITFPLPIPSRKGVKSLIWNIDLKSYHEARV